MWKEAITLFREYMGTGLIVIWFILSMIYLWVNEKRKYIRILFLYMPLVLLLMYFNPLFAELVFRVVGDEIYYRIMWLLPVTIVNAYTCVCIYGQIAQSEPSSGQRERTGVGEWKRKLPPALAAVCMGGVIVVSGSYIYANPFFHKAENLYHVPDSVVHICDMIRVPGREVMAVFPLELVQYVRQYSPVTRMPYGREITVERWNYLNPLCDAMEAEIIDMSELAPLVREAECHYVILRSDKERKGSPEEYGWIFFGETDGYEIYREPTRELVIPVLD